MPYGTDSQLDVFQAINCLATISRSLRDEGEDDPELVLYRVNSRRVVAG